MKHVLRIPILLLIILTLFLLAGCSPFTNSGNGVILGDSYHLASGQTVEHDLTVIGGNVSLDQGSTVNGNVAVIGGNVIIDGKINGDLSAIGGNVSIDSHANIQGQVYTMGGRLERASGAVVQGETQSNRPGISPSFRPPLMQVNFDPITGPLMAIFQALALAALAVVVNLFAAAPMERAGRAAMAAPAASGGVGCLTIIVLVIMAITIILIPISVLGMLVAGVAVLFGWLALGLLIGRQLAVWMRQEWSDPISAGAGTLVLTLLASLLNIIPCIGWIGGAIAGLVALGAVILSRFGTQVYPPVFSGGFTPPPPSYIPPQGAHVYGPESDLPGGNPPTNPG